MTLFGHNPTERNWETIRYILILIIPMSIFTWYGEWTTVISLLLVLGLIHFLSWISLNQKDKGVNNND